MSFTGIIPAVLTPFTPNDEVDVLALGANVEFLLERGVHGLVATGTMGEAGSLSDDERRLVVATCVRIADGRVPVLAGVSAASTRAARGYAQLSREAGADGVMSLPPINYRGDAEEIVAHYAAVAEAAQLPLMAYNNPEASGVDLSPALIARLADAVPAISCVKECSGDARRIAAILATSSLDVLVGGDDWALEGYAAGAVGWVSGVANVAPAECIALQEHVFAGRLDDARALYSRLLPLARLDMTAHLVQYFQAALDAVGLHGGPTRAPRLPLSDANAATLDAAVAALRPVAV
jgi:4-hydroxy-tetrahydrodipicolinate synthase